jgi:radical SAM superfamily enzyme YgiQ (UPF0313 family)
MKEKVKITFLVCPPFWEKLPPLGPALLSEFLSSYGFESIIHDLNIRLFHKMPLILQKKWTISPGLTEKEFFQECLEKFPELFTEILDLIQDKEIKWIGFTVYKSNRCFSLLLAEYLKSHFFDLGIVFGGPEIFTMKLEDFQFPDSIDYVVAGEGEKALLSILRGERRNKFLELIQLDDINFFPHYENLDLSFYTRKNGIPVLMSRGCLRRCHFCSEKLLFKGFRVRSPRNVFEEIETHYRDHHSRWFTFYDSLFNGDLRVLEEWLDLILKSGLKISWDAQIAVRRDMNLALFQKMKESGCVNLFVGLESGSDRVLKMMNKGFTAGMAAAFFEKLARAGLQFEVSLIAHYPGETEEDFQATLSFLKSNKTSIKKIAQVSLFRNYPGNSVEIPEDYDESLGKEKIDRLVDFFEKNELPYTKSFINNLL